MDKALNLVEIRQPAVLVLTDQLDHVVDDVSQHQHPGPDPVGDLRLLILSPLGRGAVIVHGVLAVTSGLKMRFVVGLVLDAVALATASSPRA